MTPQQLREAADTVEQLNSMRGVRPNFFVTPDYLRHEAARMEAEA